MIEFPYAIRYDPNALTSVFALLDVKSTSR